MNSGFFKVNMNDAINSLVNAVVGAVIVTLYGFVTQDGFSVFQADWALIGQTALDAAFTVFFSTLGTLLMTNKEGKVLGAIKIK
ncbi:MAG: hypothetical protein AAB706_00340 [Patescibacteria group bacterium]